MRSVSMNVYLGGVNCLQVDAIPWGVQRLAEIPHPAGAFTFIDQYLDSISFIQFWVSEQTGEGLEGLLLRTSSPSDDNPALQNRFNHANGIL